MERGLISPLLSLMEDNMPKATFKKGISVKTVERTDQVVRDLVSMGWTEKKDKPKRLRKRKAKKWLLQEI